jgi:DNA-binding NarL/FixJ family response regulator
MSRPGQGRLLIVDDDRLRARALELMLRADDLAIEIADTGKGGEEALARNRPDLVLLDVVLPDGSGIEICRRLKRHPEWRHLPVLLISAIEIASDQQAEGLEAGAVGYLSWPIGRRELVARVALAWPRPPQDPLAEAAKPGHSPLTRRQREVLRLIAEGLTTKAVAARLKISVRTAETHRAALMRRLDLHSTAELLRHAYASGFVRP